MMQRIPAKAAFQLGALSLLSAAVLAGLHAITRDTIAAKQAERTASLLAEVLPASNGEVHSLQLPEGVLPHQAWQRIDNGQVTGTALAVTAGGGYSGDIELLIGLDTTLTLTGVRVTKHRETPGLGDKIEADRSGWINTFVGKSLELPVIEQWAVKKDGGAFDQFTGATITPRAVVKGIRDTLVFSRGNHTLLLTPNIIEKNPEEASAQ